MYYRRLLTADSSPDSECGARVNSAESDIDVSPLPLPHVMTEPSVDRVMGHHVTRPGAALRFPPLRNYSPVTRSLRNSGGQGTR